LKRRGRFFSFHRRADSFVLNSRFLFSHPCRRAYCPPILRGAAGAGQVVFFL
jgi:hypothetical protein